MNGNYLLGLSRNRENWQTVINVSENSINGNKKK